MRCRYYGKKIERNEFGFVVGRYQPEIEITFKERESDLAFKRIDAVCEMLGFDYDAFGVGFEDNDVHVRISGMDDYRDFMRALRDVKKKIKK